MGNTNPLDALRAIHRNGGEIEKIDEKSVISQFPVLPAPNVSQKIIKKHILVPLFIGNMNPLDALRTIHRNS